MKKLLIIFIIVIGIYQWTNSPQSKSSFPNEKIPEVSSKAANSVIAKAFKNRQSNIQVQGFGLVERVLSDDNKGSRHQRFILRLSSGQTILIAHNIDLAPKIHSISNGDQVQFYGEYEWNQKGGVVHWTHKDPKGYHVGGWLKHNGKTYQ